MLLHSTVNIKNELPSILYKYTKRFYAAEMLINNYVWINTLHNLRNENKYGYEIGDKEEGTQKTYMGGKEIDLTNETTIPPTIKRAVIDGRIKGTGKLIIKKHISESLKDLYIYSLSTSPNLKSVFNMYDALVIIKNPLEFFEALTMGINSIFPEIKTGNFGKVKYIKREQNFDNQTEIDPCFIKDPQHAPQKEFRLVWPTNIIEISPRLFKCPNLRDIIEITKI